MAELANFGLGSFVFTEAGMAIFLQNLQATATCRSLKDVKPTLGSCKNMFHTIKR